jgi:predicted HAD superfamily Cof-like phosphohydrolase
VRLIQEEVDELKEALAEGDPVGALDALTDLQYVLDGSFLSLGLHRWKDAAVAEVHRSNMSKLDAAGQPIMRADGKILKSENYTRPDLESVMAVADADFGVSGPTRSATWKSLSTKINHSGAAFVSR